MKRPPAPPKGLRAPGARLWRSVVAEFDTTESERVQLLQAARVVDLLDELSTVLECEGVTVLDRFGATIPHPVAVELRQQRIVLARLLASLRMPDDEDIRPQHRGAARGTYQKGKR